MRRVAPFLLLMVGAGAVFLGGLGRLPLLGRDEALYAEAAREMAASGDWLTPRVNGGPFYEKPPLNYWMAALSYRAFGVSPRAARLPAALMGLLTVAVTALVGARVWGRRAGLLAGIALATCLQMALISRMGIMDVPLTCLVTIAIVVYARWWSAGWVEMLPLAGAFGLLVGLGVLLKGMAGLLPVAVVVVHSCHLLLARRRGMQRGAYRGGPPWRALAGAISVDVAMLVFAAVALPWFCAMARVHGDAFTSTLFGREHFARVTQPMQGHGGPVVYYLGVIAVSFFPWVMFVPPALFRSPPRPQALWHSLLVVWLLVVLVPFSLIRTKLPGYVTPLFPAMAVLVGAELDRRLRGAGRAPWVAVVVGCVVLGGLVSCLPALGARYGEGAGAAHAAPLLVLPVLVWVAGYAVIAAGAALALARRSARGLTAMAAGQAVVLGAALFGILPVISPYLEGGRESRLAELARGELPGSRVVLYDTRPEAVAFVLERTVECYGEEEWPQVLASLETGPTALIAPSDARELWGSLAAPRRWRVGDRMLLDLPAVPRDGT